MIEVSKKGTSRYGQEDLSSVKVLGLTAWKTSLQATRGVTGQNSRSKVQRRASGGMMFALSYYFHERWGCDEKAKPFFIIAVIVVAGSSCSSLLQARVRTSIPGPTWSLPVPGAVVHSSRPWRSSPLAGPAFSSLPSIISECSEDSHDELGGQSSQALEHAQSPSESSVVSHAPSLSGSGYTSGNASTLVQGDASTSSISLSASPTGTASSQGHSTIPTYRPQPARLSRSTGAVPTLGFFARSPSYTSELSPGNRTSISAQPALPPQARTNSYRHSRTTSLPSRSTSEQPYHSPIPLTYAPASSLPTSLPSSSTQAETHHSKQAPSTSRDPTSNWMSSSPFGPAATPKFSRLAMASPQVVMPLSAKEYRKRKARESYGNGKDDKLSAPQIRVSFADNVTKRSSMPLPQSLSDSPPVKPPRSTPAEVAPFSSAPPPLPESSQPQPARLPRPRPHSATPAVVPHPRNDPPSPPSVQSRLSSQTRSHLPIPRRSPSPPNPQLLSPKSSTNTFFSFAASSSEDEVAFPSKVVKHAAPNPASASSPNVDADPTAARPRRRKSYPDRRSGDVRLSLVDAMNRLSQEGPHNRLSVVSQTSSLNRLSVVSQASGNTLFYDFVQSQREESDGAQGGGQRAGEQPALRTQSLEDLASTLTRTGIEAVEREFENMHTVRVEVSPPPLGPRRRKLTKTRPAPARDVKQRAQERRTSFLPWVSRGQGDGKRGAEGKASGEEGRASATMECAGKGVGPMGVIPPSPPPDAGDPSHIEEVKETAHDISTLKGTAHGISMFKQHDDAPSIPPRKARRYTFQFIPAPSFHRAKRDKANSVPDTSKKGRKKGMKGIESGFGTDSTSTVTQGSQSTLVPSTLSSSSLDVSGSRSFRRFSAGIAFARSLGMGGGNSTPSLTTDGSTTTTSSSVPGTLHSFVRDPTAPFIARPSALKGSFADTSEDNSGGVVGRTHFCVRHHPRDRRPLSVMMETATEGEGVDSVDERVHGVDSERLHLPLRVMSRPGTSSSTATTATATSYASFSTAPASTRSSSPPSPSSSPSIAEEPLPNEKTVQGPIETVQVGPIETHPCALCGYPMPVPVELAKTPEENAPGKDIHPMFATPLVTISTSSALDAAPVRATGLRVGSEGAGPHTTETVRTGAKQSWDTAPATPRHRQANTQNNERKQESTWAAPTRLKRPRPQTAPPGTGDAALKFAEAIRARDVAAGIKAERELVGERAAKSGGGESKLKAVLRGWLGRA
ncbi:hypothetical protein PAXRUDRAFT_25184 [Paxillus rubicundulus Ve08.2h10]|uniref:Uncharacterized protein n=1 Tax=Paxillus rubicundulus Ve08.2h10 TaxID=930991 RepID=A0A0D0E9Y5_9AGAM|nr:hypothetical protein PAXRUDRAFT_25184 [Paxillus rubicundulus Ve08.2h10]